MKKEVEPESANWISLVFGNIFTVVKEFLMQGVMSKIDDEIDSFLAKFRDTLEEFQDDFMYHLTWRVLTLSGLVLVLVGVTYGFIDMLDVPRAYAFIVIGVLLLIGTFFFKKYLEIKKKLKVAQHGQES